MAVVTDTASGIGGALAERFAASGPSSTDAIRQDRPPVRRHTGCPSTPGQAMTRDFETEPDFQEKLDWGVTR